MENQSSNTGILAFLSIDPIFETAKKMLNLLKLWFFPRDIQLLELTSKGNSLFMKAKLSNEKYLGALNSFLINLDSSEFVKFNDIDLIEIKSLNSNNDDNEYSFEIKTKIATNYSQINKNYLIKLGSYIFVHSSLKSNSNLYFIFLFIHAL